MQLIGSAAVPVVPTACEYLVKLPKLVLARQKKAAIAPRLLSVLAFLAGPILPWPVFSTLS